MSVCKLLTFSQTLKHKNQITNYKVHDEIFDLGGKKILSKDLDKKSQVVLYKNNLSPGLYFYRLSNKDMFIVSGKIIIL
ncbi:hypothetical protein ES705_38440 [subsurface metagenome]